MKLDIDIDILLQRIDLLSAERGITRTTAFEQSGVGKNFKSNLSISKPSAGKITQLANYFDVSVDYLIGQTEDRGTKKPALTESQIDLNEIDPVKAELIKSVLSMEREDVEKISQFFDLLKKS